MRVEVCFEKEKGAVLKRADEFDRAWSSQSISGLFGLYSGRLHDRWFQLFYAKDRGGKLPKYM